MPNQKVCIGSRWWALGALATACLVAQTAIAHAQVADSASSALLTKVLRQIGAEKGSPNDAAHILVVPGCESGTSGDYCAVEYYKNTIDKKLLGLAPAVGKGALDTTLDMFVAYFGYSGIHAVDLEIIPSEFLMPSSKAGLAVLRDKVISKADFDANPELSVATFKSGNLLSSAFFAPKIVDYNLKPNDPATGLDPHNAGWRKLIRLIALPKSKAFKDGAKSAYILFNFVEPDASITPFPTKIVNGELANEKKKQQSVNNQVIVVPRTFAHGIDDAILFLDYQPFNPGPGKPNYPAGLFLSAAFDTLGSDPKTSKRNYYMPSACAECHGHDFERGAAVGLKDGRKTFPYGKVNYLDTDQWYDMMKFDFPKASAGAFDVVFDGGKDHDSSRYKAAVGVVRALNREIRTQNIAARRPKDPKNEKVDAFKIQAASKWLSLHQHGEGPVDAGKRSIGSRAWLKADRPLLDRLDHYCFRCHSSIRYNVFDKAAVLNRNVPSQSYHDGQIRTYINWCFDAADSDNCFMPQGRRLTQPERKALSDYLKALK